MLKDGDRCTFPLGRDLQKRAGWVGDTYANAEAVLDALLADPPDCVLVDIMMPSIDGFALLTRIRAQSR